VHAGLAPGHPQGDHGPRRRPGAVYDPAQVGDYFAAVTQAALALAEFSAPYRGRSTPVNAWWGSFDLAVTLYSGAPAEPSGDGFITRNSDDAEQIVVGYPGLGRRTHGGESAGGGRGVRSLGVPARLPGV